jgi:polyprenyl-phospho-N-acetylgalactosaminyl synthase
MSGQANIQTVFVVVPAFNEGESIEKVVNELTAFNCQVVVVDDGSVNPLSPVLERTTAYVLRHPINMGQGAALQTGIDFALEQDAKIIVTFDADGQHCASDIPLLISTLLQQNCDVVLGSRFLHDANAIPARRKFVLQAARVVNFFFTGFFLSDAHNGFRAFTAEAAKRIRINQPRMAHATEILSQLKTHRLRYREVPVTVNYTAYSMAKGQRSLDGFRIVFDLFLNKFFK